jgi:hypothetical protein
LASEADVPKFIDPLTALSEESRHKLDDFDAFGGGDSTDSSNSDTRYFITGDK